MRRGTSTYDSKPLVDCSHSTRPLVEKPLGFFSHGGTEQKPCCRWCLRISGQVRSTQLSKSGECRVFVVRFPIEMAISGRPHITPQRWVRQKRWYPWITSTWWSITQELAAMLCWAAARASACFKPPCCFRSHPSHPSHPMLGGLVSIRFPRKGAQWCQALARLDCLGYRAAPDVVSFNCGISACGQVGFKSSPSKQIIAIWIFGIIYGWSPTWCSNITQVTTRTWIITGIQLEEFIVNNYSLSRRSNPVTSSRKNLDEF